MNMFTCTAQTTQARFIPRPAVEVTPYSVQTWVEFKQSYRILNNDAFDVASREQQNKITKACVKREKMFPFTLYIRAVFLCVTGVNQ